MAISKKTFRFSIFANILHVLEMNLELSKNYQNKTRMAKNRPVN